MREYMNEAFKAVYLPMTVLTGTLIVISIFISTVYRNQNAVDERLNLLELYTIESVDTLSTASFSLDGTMNFLHHGSSSLFSRINRSGSFIIAAVRDDEMRIIDLDNGKIGRASCWERV